MAERYPKIPAYPDQVLQKLSLFKEVLPRHISRKILPVREFIFFIP
jgi:hypothetical protein